MVDVVADAQGGTTAATGEGGATGPSEVTDSAAAAASSVRRSLGTALQVVGAAGAEGSAGAAASAGGASLGCEGTGAGAATAEQQQVAAAAALIGALDFNDPTGGYKRLQSPAPTPPPSPGAWGASSSRPAAALGHHEEPVFSASRPEDAALLRD